MFNHMAHGFLFYSILEHGCLFFLFIALQIATLKHRRVKKPVFVGQSMRVRAAIGGSGGGGDVCLSSQEKDCSRPFESPGTQIHLDERKCLVYKRLAMYFHLLEY